MKQSTKDKISRSLKGRKHSEKRVKAIKDGIAANPEQFKEACHYTNLQPLWAKENLVKGSKIPK